MKHHTWSILCVSSVLLFQIFQRKQKRHQSENTEATTQVMEEKGKKQESSLKHVNGLTTDGDGPLHSHMQIKHRERATWLWVIQHKTETEISLMAPDASL